MLGLLVKFEDRGGGLGSDPAHFRGEGPGDLSGRAEFLSYPSFSPMPRL